MRSFMIVERSTPERFGGLHDRVLAAHQADPDLVLLARRQKPLAAPAPRAGTVAAGLIAHRSLLDKPDRLPDAD
jgi:hypothetical protein